MWELLMYISFLNIPYELKTQRGGHSAWLLLLLLLLLLLKEDKVIPLQARCGPEVG